MVPYIVTLLVDPAAVDRPAPPAQPAASIDAASIVNRSHCRFTSSSRKALREKAEDPRKVVGPVQIAIGAAIDGCGA